MRLLAGPAPWSALTLLVWLSCSSSESETDEEEPALPTSDLGGVPWKEAVRIHALLKGKGGEELEASKGQELGKGEDGDEDEEYEEDGDDGESSEGQKTPPTLATGPSA